MTSSIPPPPSPGSPALTPGAPETEPDSPEPVSGEQPMKEGLNSFYPPFPKYDGAPALVSVADAIKAGRVLRAKDKAMGASAPIGPLPRPARPRRPKVTDIPMSPRERCAHASCLRKQGVLTDRLEYMAKPPRRTILYLWRDHADTLPPETIARLRSMLDADEPFKPDKAYDYFLNMRKSRKANKKTKINQLEKDINSTAQNKQHVWQRNVTVAFARGVQERLRRPGRYVLADGMLRLSNIILNELCGYMKMRSPCRDTHVPKGRFMIEMADKVAVWIDGILAESDDRMLMMDFDEDLDLEPPSSSYFWDGKDEKMADRKVAEKKVTLAGPKSGKSMSEEAKWVDAEGGAVPPGAVVAGQTSSGKPVYVARAEHDKSLIPGNLVPSTSGAAQVASGGGQQAISKYQVLVGGSGIWQRASGPDIPADALPGGNSQTGEVLYVGRANHEGGVIVGMVSKSLGSLLIAFDGKQVAIKDYEILMK